jgi:hypothetical protein
MSVFPTNDQALPMPPKILLDEKSRMTTKQHLYAILNDFCDNTSMHGLRLVSRHTIFIAKSVWFLSWRLLHASDITSLYW